MEDHLKHGRNWCFTGWPHKDCDDVDALWKKWGSKLSYIGGGDELTKKDGKHIQGWLQFKSVCWWNTVKKILPSGKYWFDLCEGNEGSNEKYCGKDGNFTAHGEWTVTGQGKQKTVRTLIIADIRKGLSLTQIWNKYPSAMILYNRGVEQAFAQLQPDLETAEYEMDTFNRLPITDFKKSIILCGPPGIGKTQFALAHFKKPLLVSHMDDLGRFNKSYDGIVFDDMSFNHMPRSGQIHVLDIANTRSIHIRYTCAKIPKHTKKIFCTNKINIFDWEDKAIRRRARFIEVESHLYKIVTNNKSEGNIVDKSTGFRLTDEIWLG